MLWRVMLYGSQTWAMRKEDIKTGCFRNVNLEKNDGKN